MAVWDKFLTEADRTHSFKQPPVHLGLGNKPAILMVDMYRSAFGHSPQPLLEAIASWPSSCGLAAWESLPHSQHLLEAGRIAGVPVIHITGLAELPSWREERMASGRGADLEKRAEQYTIVDEVGPIHGEIVFRKAAPSAFWGTALAGYLNQIGADSIIVAGQTTSGCIRATVVDACSFRYPVTVVEECVFDRTEAAHAINLFDMAHKYADVVTVENLTGRLK